MLWTAIDVAILLLHAVRKVDNLPVDGDVTDAAHEVGQRGYDTLGRYIIIWQSTKEYIAATYLQRCGQAQSVKD